MVFGGFFVVFFQLQLAYIILSFLLQSYKITELQPLWISDQLPWSTKKWENTDWVRFTAPCLFHHKGNSKFETLLLRIFSLK